METMSFPSKMVLIDGLFGPWELDPDLDGSVPVVILGVRVAELVGL